MSVSDWERVDDSFDTIFQSDTFGRINRGSGGGGGCVEDGLASRDAGWGRPVDGSCVRREFDPDIDVTREVEVLSRITQARNFEELWLAMEGSPHAGVHNHVGGSMRRNFSPDDPIFWLHQYVFI